MAEEIRAEIAAEDLAAVMEAVAEETAEVRKTNLIQIPAPEIIPGINLILIQTPAEDLAEETAAAIKTKTETPNLTRGILIILV